MSIPVLMGSENGRPRTGAGNFWGDLLLNIVLPLLILKFGNRLLPNASVVLVVALAFPTCYFIYDWVARQRRNWIAVIGFVSVLLTGGVGLLELPRFWVIVKETAIPALIGLVIAGSALSSRPLIQLIVFTREIFDVDRIRADIQERGQEKELHRILRFSTLLLAGSFFVSAILNFVLAVHFIKTEPSVDKEQFNSEIGTMTGVSYLVIALPTTILMVGILWYVAHSLSKLTGEAFEQLLAPQLRDSLDGENSAGKSTDES